MDGWIYIPYSTWAVQHYWRTGSSSRPARWPNKNVIIKKTRGPGKRKTYFPQPLLSPDGLDDHPVPDASQQGQRVESESRGDPDGQTPSAHGPAPVHVLMILQEIHRLITPSYNVMHMSNMSMRTHQRLSFNSVIPPRTTRRRRESL